MSAATAGGCTCYQSISCLTECTSRPKELRLRPSDWSSLPITWPTFETPGFKRDIPTFQARFAEAIQQGHDYPGSESINDVGGGVKLAEVDVDFSNATLRQTEIPTDFAVHGEGFFQVLTPEGEQLLTRAGDFKIDPLGQLVTQTGKYKVLDNAGVPIKIDTSIPWEVQRGGMISQEGQSTTIGLQKPQSLGDLVKVGNNLFSPTWSYQQSSIGRARYPSRLSRDVGSQFHLGNDDHDRNFASI